MTKVDGTIDAGITHNLYTAVDNSLFPCADAEFEACMKPLSTSREILGFLAPTLLKRQNADLAAAASHDTSTFTRYSVPPDPTSKDDSDERT